LKKINKENPSKTSLEENNEVSNLNKELENLININESLKTGISKMFKEIEKKNNTNTNNLK